MSGIMVPQSVQLSKNMKNVSVQGSVSYFPDGCVKIVLDASSKDGSLRVVGVQASLRDEAGKVIRQLPKFEVCTDGRTKGLQGDLFNHPVAAWFIRKTHSVKVDIFEIRLPKGTVW